jgi:hypothetical protein
VALGRTNATSLRASRTVGAIARADVLTVVNGVLVTLFVLVVATGRWQNGLFAGVVLARPLLAWKGALIAAMAAIAVAVVAICPLGGGIVLLHVTPRAELATGVLGVGGALLVELCSRVFSATPAAPRTRSAPAR